MKILITFILLIISSVSYASELKSNHQKLDENAIKADAVNAEKVKKTAIIVKVKSEDKKNDGSKDASGEEPIEIPVAAQTNIVIDKSASNKEIDNNQQKASDKVVKNEVLQK